MKGHPDDEIEPWGPEVAAFSEMCGVNADTIARRLAGTRLTMSFTDADKLVCAIGKPMLWQRPEFWPYYHEGRPVPPDRARPIKCRNPRCGGWFSIDPDEPGTWKRKYCNDACARAGQRIQNGEGPTVNGEMMTFVCEFCLREETVPRQPGYCTRRRACSSEECKKALKASLMRDHRERRRRARKKGLVAA